MDRLYGLMMTDGDDEEWTGKLSAERDRAATEGRPHARPLACGLRSNIGAPLPSFLQWEHEVHLFFNLADLEGVGRVIFENCFATIFGPAGENGHALQGSGWEAYRPMEVVNSWWLADMFGEAPGLSHFLFPFHDTTFECIAESFDASRLTVSMAEAVQASLDRWD